MFQEVWMKDMMLTKIFMIKLKIYTIGIKKEKKDLCLKLKIKKKA